MESRACCSHPLRLITVTSINPLPAAVYASHCLGRAAGGSSRMFFVSLGCVRAVTANPPLMCFLGADRTDQRAGAGPVVA